MMPQPQVSRAVVRKQVFTAANSTDMVIDIVHLCVRSRHTGQLIVNMSQGGINGVTVEDKQQLAIEESTCG
jgi:hypothetical protein